MTMKVKWDRKRWRKRQLESGVEIEDDELKKLNKSKKWKYWMQMCLLKKWQKDGLYARYKQTKAV